MADIKQMQLGQLVDYCIDYNERQEKSEHAQEHEDKHPKKRKATQADINSFFG